VLSLSVGMKNNLLEAIAWTFSFKLPFLFNFKKEKVQAAK